MPRITKQPNTAVIRARRQRGFERKEVSWLLGHKGPQALAQYEQGKRLPSLENAIRLSLVYGCEIEDLFPERYKLARADVFERTTSHRLIGHNRIQGLVKSINRCSYEDALDNEQIAAAQRTGIRDHVTRLAKVLTQL